MPLITTHFTAPILSRCELLLCNFDQHQWQPDSPQQYQVNVPAYLLNKAVNKRLAEFVAGRHLAKTLLQKAGKPVHVGRNEKTRAPIWPAGITGSITHSKGIAACAIQPNSLTAGIGIDVEHWTPAKTAASISKEVWLPEEQAEIMHVGWANAQALTIIFSAKEAIYKALYPQVLAYFGFMAVTLRQLKGDSKSGLLCFELIEDLSTAIRKGSMYYVEYYCDDKWVLTGIELPPN